MNKSKLNLLWCFCGLFYFSFVCMSAYANVYFKTICECIRKINIRRSEVNYGSAIEPGASGLPYYCTSTCARSGCTRRANCVDSKPKMKNKISKIFLWLLYLDSTRVYIRLKYKYSVISIIDKRLPGNTKKWTIARSWPFRVRFLHSWAAAGMPFDSGRRFRASLLLHTTCVHLCCDWVASCVVA